MELATTADGATVAAGADATAAMVGAVPQADCNIAPESVNEQSLLRHAAKGALPVDISTEPASPADRVEEAGFAFSTAPPPFTARTDWDDFAACHKLALALLPTHRLRALLVACDGIPQAALRLPHNALASPSIGLTPKQIARLDEARNFVVPDKLRAKAGDLDVWACAFGSAAYPANLAPLTDAPPLLFVRGTLQADDKFSVAIVGSRRATLYGREQAERFARAFAPRGLTVVSGGAAGIDTFAHRAALEAGGRTIAVLGCGLDVVYPSENRALFAQIATGERGALVSEFPLDTKPEPWRFPTRNRIIAGMTRLTLLVETPSDSGALITARNAGEYGRDVWAVPGPVNGGRSQGCHKLIQDGAGLADSPNDIFQALGLPASVGETEQQSDLIFRGTTYEKAMPSIIEPIPMVRRREEKPSSSDTPTSQAPSAQQNPPPVPTNLSPDEAALLAQFDLTARHLDEASQAANLTSPQASVAATLLEMKNLIKRHPGGFFARVL